MKVCTKCGGNKPVAEFYKDPRYDTLRSWCKKCCNEHSKKWNQSNPQKHVESTVKWRTSNEVLSKYSKRDYHLRKNYGINSSRYNELLNKQSGACAICNTDKPGGIGRFHVDHDHSTNKVRGLLCNNCNTAIGLFKERIDALESAIEYLNAGGTINA